MNDDPVIMAALLGAARPEALPSSPDDRLAPTWEELDRSDPPTALLGALALTRSLRLAGMKTAEAVTPADPAPAESRPELPPRAIDGLLRMLGGEFREVLPEWLRRAGSLDAVAPPRVLPELLEAGRRDARLRPALARLAGERGRWIAGRREGCEWIRAEAAAGTGGWDADHPAERLAWLREARRRDPAGCAARIDESWAGESPDFREALARLAAEEPRAADGSWLETKALRERRSDTRRFAAGALAQIPDSAFSHRALDRLRPCVTIRTKLLRTVLEVEPPDRFDPSWADDGLVEKPPARTGGKAWWLRQIVAAVPLDRWSGLLGLGAGKWLALPVDSDWREPLVLGWLDAALAAPALACAAEFLPWLARLDPWPAAAPTRRELVAALLPRIAASDRSALLDSVVTALPAAEWGSLLVALSDDPPLPGPRVLGVIRNALAPKSALTRPEARLLALWIPLDAIPAELERLAKLPELSAAAEEFATTLEFRRALLAPA